MDLRKVDLVKLNTATKYPSIATYHALGERGRLTEQTTAFAADSCEPVYVREKIDGSNARIIMFGDQWIIGSREELLTANGDLIFNPSQGIVEELRPVAERMMARQQGRYGVYYFEVYGGKVGRNAGNYHTSGTTGHRLFDIMTPANPWFETMLRDKDREQIALWRDGGNGEFADQDLLERLAELDGLPLVPNLGKLPAHGLPRGVQETREWMAELISATQAHLDGGHGRPEGLILRTDNAEWLRRAEVRKLRFEDYDRTLKASR